MGHLCSSTQVNVFRKPLKEQYTEKTSALLFFSLCISGFYGSFLIVLMLVCMCVCVCVVMFDCSDLGD